MRKGQQIKILNDPPSIHICRFEMVEQQQRDDFIHSCQELQLCKETLEKQSDLIGEQSSRHSNLNEGHTVLRGLSNISLLNHFLDRTF